MFDKKVKNHNKTLFLALPIGIASVLLFNNVAIAKPLAVPTLTISFAPTLAALDVEEDEDPASASPDASDIRDTKIYIQNKENSLLDRLIAAEAQTLSIDQDKFASDMSDFAGMVKYIESTGKKDATNPYSGAMSYYQFLPNSVVTAVNRLEIFMKKNEMGLIPMWAVDVRNNPASMYDLSLERQTILTLVNIFEQRGSDTFLTKMGNGNNTAAKDLYYIYHHTAPDSATIARTDQTFPRYFD